MRLFAAVKNSSGSLRAPAVSTGILIRHGQSGIVSPGLDEAHGLGERGIGFEDLGEPSPEDHDVAIWRMCLETEIPYRKSAGRARENCMA